MKTVGVVKGLWRYPVKSMRGEKCDSLLFENRGAVGDRFYTVKNEAGKFGSGKDTRRFVKIDDLFNFSSFYDGEIPVILFPDGKTARGDDPAIHSELSKALNQAVTLSEEKLVSHFDDSPVHIVTTASLDWLKAKLPLSVIDERRFRPNIVIETEVAAELLEQSWIGKSLEINGVVLEIMHPTVRCVMVNFPQSEIPEDKRIFAGIGRESDLNFGVYARVSAGGDVRFGEKVKII